MSDQLNHSLATESERSPTLRPLIACVAGAWALSLAVLAPLAAAAQQPAPPADAGRFLERTDQNHDGVVTKAEFVNSREEMAKKLDRNSDGVIDSRDAPRMRRGKQKYEERMRDINKHFDVDNDGVVTTSEFVNGPTYAFDQADANGDGMVTKEELDAAKAAFEAARKN